MLNPNELRVIHNAMQQLLPPNYKTFIMAVPTDAHSLAQFVTNANLGMLVLELRALVHSMEVAMLMNGENRLQQLAADQIKKELEQGEWLKDQNAHQN